VTWSDSSIVRPIFMRSTTALEFLAHRARDLLRDDAERLGHRQARTQAAHEQLDAVGKLGVELAEARLHES
jgi:hypothetical protein